MSGAPETAGEDSLAYELRQPETVEDYRRFNPKSGMLPVMTIDDEWREDSGAIVEWLDQCFPDPPLFSSDPRAAAQQRHLAEWVEQAFLWYWQRWQDLRPGGRSTLPVSGSRNVDPPPLADSPRPTGVSLRAWLGRRRRGPGEAHSPEVDRLSREVAHRVDDLSRLLADRSFFYFDRLGVADLSVYCMLVALDAERLPNARSASARHRNLVEFRERVQREAGRA